MNKVFLIILLLFTVPDSIAVYLFQSIVSEGTSTVTFRALKSEIGYVKVALTNSEKKLQRS